MNKKFNDFIIGVLGGGQLGRMMLQKAIDFSLTIKVLDPDPDAPCSHLAEEFVVGDFNDFDTVYKFGKKCDLITIEIEHVNVDALAKLESEGVLVYPQPHIIRMIQDKGDQKNFFKKNNIPSAEYFLIENKNDLQSKKSLIPSIQKIRKGGYDGRGVFKISSEDDIRNAFDAPSVIENKVNIKKEIAVIAARNASGEIVTFPPVEMDFNPEANLVEFLYSPAMLDPTILSKANEIAIHLTKALGIVGLIAVEMFLTEKDELLVNEIAPRPHNSGHHTIEACITSQFEQHLRAILGLPFGRTDVKSAAVMVNLLGEKNYQGKAIYQSFEDVLKMDGVFIHLYGKKITKPMRKMGHVTVLGNSMEEAIKKAIVVKNKIKIISE